MESALLALWLTKDMDNESKCLFLLLQALLVGLLVLFFRKKK